MALTNTQYETIQKSYEERQTRSRYLLNARRNEVYAKIPEFEELESSAGALSAAHARRLLEGEDKALEELHQALAALSGRKENLLLQAGFPRDFLEMVHECPHCGDTGYIQGEKCRCFRQQEIAILYEQSNIQEMVQKENFSTLSDEFYQGEDLTRFQAAAKLSREFVLNFRRDYHNLFFYGTVGTGKSFLSGCIAKELLQMGCSVIYFSASGLFETLARFSFDMKSKETLYNFYKDLYNCDLVIIDDLGTEITNSFVTSGLFTCLNERNLRRHSTIISTNLNLEELRARYSDRIFSRITSNFSICKLSGQDIRMYKKINQNVKSHGN